LRQTDDPIERIGIERTWAEIDKADVVVHLVDASGIGITGDPAATAADAALFAAIDARAPAGAARLVVRNKIDLAGVVASAREGEVRLSALSGAGIDLLRSSLLAIAGFQPGAEDVFAARERHLHALREALEHVALAGDHGTQGDQVLDLFAEELRLAHQALGRITGAMTPDDLLGVIFSRFCIGK
jgi:tRNA modification GTPase